MIDWLVVGAGMHGMAVAVALRRAGVPVGRIAILDPHPEPLARWGQRTRAVEMTMLRSPALHHLDPIQTSLLTYAASVGRGLPGIGVPPPLDVFNAHARSVVAGAGLWSAPLPGEARGMVRQPHGWRVEADRGALEARRVVLAVGGGERGRWPGWATAVRSRGVSIQHVFDPGYVPRTDGPLAVIGVGLSGVQVALGAAARGQPVVLIGHRPPRVTDYDADVCWFAPASAAALGVARDPAGRREIVRRARHRGAINPSAAARLSAQIAEGRITVTTAPLSRVVPVGKGVELVVGGTTHRVDGIVLATGLDDVPPTGWIARTARTLGLPVAPDGTPVPTPSLQWAPGLFVCGALAELELGPVARSVAGGRRAAEIVALHR